MKKTIIISASFLFILSTCFFVSAQTDSKKQITAQNVNRYGQKAPAAGPGQGLTTTTMPRPSFGFISGTVVKVDTSDPANIKLEVKSDYQDQNYVLTVMPWTNITKITDVSELKAGTPVRVMTRKADDKESAINIMFGDIQKLPIPPSLAASARAPVEQGKTKR